MSFFEEWQRRHLAADPQEPASPPQPIKHTVTEPNDLQIGPDREQLRDYEPFMSSVSAAMRSMEQRFSQAVEDSLAEFTALTDES